MRVMSARDAIATIKDGATLTVGGTGPVLEPDLLLSALETRFLEDGHPAGLRLVLPMLPGDRKGEGGLNCFAHPGMAAHILGASFARGRHPKLLDLIREEQVEGYIVGMGTLMQLLTASGAGKPGVFTTVGLGSFMDPRREGGAMNARSTRPPGRIEVIDGKEYIFYPALNVDVALIRGTTADENGYISFEEEPNSLGAAELALACKSNGGTVIAQVKRIARAGSLDPKLVRVPGPLVDIVCVHPRQTQLSPVMQDPLEGWNPFLTGAHKHPLTGLVTIGGGAERNILRRAAQELRVGDVVNLGAGVATKLPLVAHQEGILDRVVFTNEHGVFGGMMGTALGGSFVPALNADAVMDSAFQFNYYDGGNLNVTFLGVGEVDARGNLNVSKFGPELNGPGGFNNITDRTKRIVFCGTLTSGGLQVRLEAGRLAIEREGRHRKYVPEIEQVTFNAERAYAKGQSVLYVTERCVFRLGAEGLELSEVAPGIDVVRDIQPNVGFPIRQAGDLREMDAAIFAEAPMGLAASIAEKHI